MKSSFVASTSSATFKTQLFKYSAYEKNHLRKKNNNIVIPHNKSSEVSEQLIEMCFPKILLLSLFFGYKIAISEQKGQYILCSLWQQ